jgi:uncharacterized protein YvpB
MILACWQTRTVAAQTVAVHSARSENAKIVTGSGYPLWSAPYQKGVRQRGTAKSLSKQLVQLNQVAKTTSGTYYHISRRGHDYGWINKTGLSTPKSYVLPYTYTSQLYPLYAPNACEAASLKMALSVKGIALKTSLKALITAMPKSSDPNKGFKGNPYKESPRNVVWTIYPKPLAAFARRYDKTAYNFTGASQNQLITEIKRGNPVVVAGSWHFQNGRPYHVLALVGYRTGQFLVADPYMQKSWANKSFWVSTWQFMHVFADKTRHSRAVVVR